MKFQYLIFNLAIIAIQHQIDLKRQYVFHITLYSVCTLHVQTNVTLIATTTRHVRTRFATRGTRNVFPITKRGLSTNSQTWVIRIYSVPDSPRRDLWFLGSNHHSSPKGLPTGFVYGLRAISIVWDTLVFNPLTIFKTKIFAIIW